MQNKQTVMEFMRRVGFRRAVGSFVIGTQLLAHTVVFADAMSDVGRSAQSDGQIWGNSAAMPSLNGGALNLGGGQSLSTQDLYPGTSQEGNWFPDGIEPNIGDLQSVFESAPGMEAAGDWRKANLWQDAHSDNPSIEGAAYKILLDAAQNNRHEQAFETDPSFQTTNTVFANAEEFANSFGDCSVVYTPKQITRNIHMPDEQMCERIQKPQVDCDITHTISVETIKETKYINAALSPPSTGVIPPFVLSVNFETGLAQFIDSIWYWSEFAWKSPLFYIGWKINKSEFCAQNNSFDIGGEYRGYSWGCGDGVSPGALIGWGDRGMYPTYSRSR